MEDSGADGRSFNLMIDAPEKGLWESFEISSVDDLFDNDTTHNRLLNTEMGLPFRLSQNVTQGQLHFAKFGSAYRVEVRSVSDSSVTSFFSTGATIITSYFTPFLSQGFKKLSYECFRIETSRSKTTGNCQNIWNNVLHLETLKTSYFLQRNALSTAPNRSWVWLQKAINLTRGARNHQTLSYDYFFWVRFIFQQEVGLQCLNATGLDDVSKFEVELTAATMHKDSKQTIQSESAKFEFTFGTEGLSFNYLVLKIFLLKRKLVFKNLWTKSVSKIYREF